MSLPSRTTNERRCWGSVPIRLSPRPRRRQRSTPQGLFVMNESAPPSRVKPSRRRVQIAPPRRSLASSTTTSTGRRAVAARSTSRCATARPDRPPPITTTRSLPAERSANATTPRCPTRTNQCLASFYVPRSRGRQAEIPPARSHLGLTLADRGGPIADRALDQVAQGPDERGVVVDRAGADHVQPEVAAGPRGLQIQIIHDFDVIGNEPDRAEDHIASPLGGQGGQGVVDVGLEPGGLRAAAPALPDEAPGAALQVPGDVPAGRLDLLDVGAAVRHGRGDAVRGEEEPGRAASPLGLGDRLRGRGGPGRPAPRRRGDGRTRARRSRSGAPPRGRRRRGLPGPSAGRPRSSDRSGKAPG